MQNKIKGGIQPRTLCIFFNHTVYEADQINGEQLLNARKWEYRSFLWQRLNNKITLINTTTSAIGNIDHSYLDCCDPPRIGFFSSCYINFRPIRKVWIIICPSRSPGRNFLVPFSNFLVLSLRHYIDNCMHACVGKTKCAEYIELFDWLMVEFNQSEYLLYRWHKTDLSGLGGSDSRCNNSLL